MNKRGRPRNSDRRELKTVRTSMRMSTRTKTELDTLHALTGEQMSQIIADALHEYYIRKSHEKSERRRQLDGWKE